MLISILLIFIAGGIGAVCRFFISYTAGSYIRTSFPIGTLIANLLGSFIMGIAFALFEIIILPDFLKMAVTVGFLGGFTTFSSFALESTNLLRNREYKFFIYNILISNILGIACVISGMAIIHLILK